MTEAERLLTLVQPALAPPETIEARYKPSDGGPMTRRFYQDAGSLVRSFHPWATVAEGAQAWQTFVTRATTEDIRAAIGAAGLDKKER